MSAANVEKIVLENCEVGFRYSPKLPVSDLKNYGLSGMTNRARKFHLVYNDGCSVLEDGTPCPDKIINFEYKNILFFYKKKILIITFIKKIQSY